MSADVMRGLFLSTGWGVLVTLMLLGLALILLTIGLIAICRADRKDIPAVLRALAGWFSWGRRSQGR